MNRIIETVAGTGVLPGSNLDNEGGLAREAKINANAVAAAPDGGFYIGSSFTSGIRHVSKEGIITTLYPRGGLDPTITPIGIDLTPDGDVLAATSFSIWRIRPDGTPTRIAGSPGSLCPPQLGDGGPAVDACLADAFDVAVAPDGTFFIADNNHDRVRRVGPDGIITTYVGGGSLPMQAGVLATSVFYSRPVSVALDGEGHLYFTSHQRVWRCNRSGILEHVAGRFGLPMGAGDGGPATEASLGTDLRVTVAPDGTVYIMDHTLNRVRAVRPDGIIIPITGQAGIGFSGDGGPAQQAKISTTYKPDVMRDGSLLLPDSGNSRVRKILPPLDGTTEGDIVIASEDGSDVYVFDPRGRHLRTQDPRTNATRLSFGYDAQSQLVTVTDAEGAIPKRGQSTISPPANV